MRTTVQSRPPRIWWSRHPAAASPPRRVFDLRDAAMQTWYRDERFERGGPAYDMLENGTFKARRKPDVGILSSHREKKLAASAEYRPVAVEGRLRIRKRKCLSRDFTAGATLLMTTRRFLPSTCVAKRIIPPRRIFDLRDAAMIDLCVDPGSSRGCPCL
jgi:hypothetical protein